MSGFYLDQATALFRRIAERHALLFTIEADAPIEVLWTLPMQQGLCAPVTLGLQNGDELNFGVLDFWSTFFPFDRVASTFEHAVDAWIEGSARIAHVRLGGRALQLHRDGKWRTIYRANCLLPVPRNPRRVDMNRPLATAG